MTGVWETRPDGQVNQTGYFNAARGGTDYSQQSAAQLTLTDGVANGTTTVTSATGGFIAAMVGNGLAIQGVSWYEIVAVNSANSVTVDRTVGSATGLSLRVGGASTLTTTGLAPGFQGVLQAGQKVWLRGTNAAGVSTQYGVSSFSTLASVATASAPLSVNGYGLNRGDGAKAVISVTQSSGQVVPASFEIWNNLQFIDNRSGASLALFELSGSGHVGVECENVTLTGGGSAPLFEDATTGCATFIACLFDGNGTTQSIVSPFIEESNGAYYRDCVFKGFNPTGEYAIQVSPSYTGVFEGCLFIDNPGTGGGAVAVLNGTLAQVTFRRCIFWGNGGDGVAIQSGELMITRFEDCIFGKNAGYDINSLDSSTTTSARQLWAAANNRCNYFYTTGTARYNNLTAAPSETTLTADPFNGDASGDFSLNSAVGGGAAITGGLCQTTLPGVTNVIDTQIAGPYGGVGTAGTSSSTVSMRSLWRELTNERNTQVIPDSVVDLYLDFGLQELNRRLHYHYTTASDIVLVAGQQEYPMPVAAIEIVWVQYANNRLLEKGDVEQWRRLGEDWRNEPAGEPRFFAHYASQFVIRPAPSALAVAAAPNLTVRRKDTPPSITTNGPEQLPIEAYRPVVLYGAALWSAAYPDSVVAQQRAAFLKTEFEAAVSAMVESYARRSISL